MSRDLLAAIPGGRALVVLATAAAVVWGVVSLETLPRGIYPEVDFPRIAVVARAGDLPPDVMVASATRPLEQAIATVPGIQRLARGPSAAPPSCRRSSRPAPTCAARCS